MLADFNRTPVVGDTVTIFSSFNKYAVCTVTSTNSTQAIVTVGQVVKTKGADGSSDYNVLTNIPVINQDLSASGFTPVANTYYRHTGATTDTFTQGIIYLYDTAYHKLGESGGGATGSQGNDALVYNILYTGDIYVNHSITLLLADFNRTPVVGDTVTIFSSFNKYAVCTVTSTNSTQAIVTVGQVVKTKGADGSSDYNVLTNIPVINQDLSASGFTPVANTYYRHTGATTDTFTQGIIYLYDTAYHKLGESGGGGTTLNRYITTLGSTTDDSLKFIRILRNAKSIISIGAQAVSTWFPMQFGGNSSVAYLSLNGIYTQSSDTRLFGFTIDTKTGQKNDIALFAITTSNVTRSNTANVSSLRVEYSNDTEII